MFAANLFIAECVRLRLHVNRRLLSGKYMGKMGKIKLTCFDKVLFIRKRISIIRDPSSNSEVGSRISDFPDGKSEILVATRKSDLGLPG